MSPIHTLHTLHYMTTYLMIIILSALYELDPGTHYTASAVVVQEARDKITQAQQKASDIGTRLGSNSGIIHAYKGMLSSMLPLDTFVACLGLMLGDSSIYPSAAKDKASLHFEYGNLAYAQFVYSLLIPYVLTGPVKKERFNGNGTLVTTYTFQTMTLPCFAVFYNLFIDDKGVKTVPMGLILFLLSPVGLSTWFTDDGGQADYRPGHGKTVHLNTQGFTESTVNQMVLELNVRYNLNCRTRLLTNKKNQPIIVIPSQSYPVFYDLVSPHVPAAMAYKLPAPNVGPLCVCVCHRDPQLEDS